MKYAYDSFNQNVEKAFDTIAAGVPIIFARKGAMPDALPANFLLVVWLNYGAPSKQIGEYVAVIQLDLVCSNFDLELALNRAKAIDDYYGFNRGSGQAFLNRCDNADNTLSEMILTPLNSGWIEINERDPAVIHLQKTLRLRFQT
jgi:hypothetical protein